MRVYKEGLDERKINLDDDYIKFIRLAETFIEKNGHGIVAMITNNSFLDGATQRVMRKHLLETFDDIYVLNLHGDIRNESAGNSENENVFDITQGVSISILISQNGQDRKTQGKIRYRDLAGSRQKKYAQLEKSSIYFEDFAEIVPSMPYLRFKPEASGDAAVYEAGFNISSFFGTYSSGIQTKRDAVCISTDKATLERTLLDFERLTEAELRSKYSLPPDGRDWTVVSAKADIKSGNGSVVPFLYKPFDKRFIFYSGKTKGFVAYPRREVMQHIVGKQNVALIVNRQTVKDDFSFVGVTDLGSRLIDPQSQNMTVAASATAERKVLAHLS